MDGLGLHLESPARVIAADWLIAMDAPGPRAVRNGGVRVDAGGTIVAAGPFEELLRPGDALTFHRDAVLTPGLINAHAHLDMSYWTADARAALAGRPLHDWVVPVVAERFLRTAGQIAAAAAEGARASLAAGVTTVADVTPASIAWGEVLDAVAATPIRRVALAEVIGFGPRGESVWADAERAIEMPDDECQMPNHDEGDRSLLFGNRHLAFGISPHAPYSTSAELYIRCLSAACRVGLPLMTHLAETPEEVEFCRSGSGPWRRRLEQLAGPQPDLEIPACSPVAYANRLGLLDHSPTLLAHVNYLEPGDLDLLAPSRERTWRATLRRGRERGRTRRSGSLQGASGPTVVYCPRTAEFFGHRNHRWREMLAAGVNVAIGTDSLASSPDLSVLAELRFLRQRHADVPAGVLFALATRRAAAGLGLAGRLGALVPGACADLVAWAIAPTAAPDPAESILACVIENQAAPRAVYVGGGAVP